MLGALFGTPALAAVTEALRSARADGRLAVIGHARLAAALAPTGDIVPVGLSPRAAKKHAGALADLSSIEDGALAGIVGVDLATRVDWEAALRDCVRAVRDGGALVFVDRGRAAEASRRALCAGLAELEQRHAGRLVITSGLVSHF